MFIAGVVVCVWLTNFMSVCLFSGEHLVQALVLLCNP